MNIREMWPLKIGVYSKEAGFHPNIGEQELIAMRKRMGLQTTIITAAMAHKREAVKKRGQAKVSAQ